MKIFELSEGRRRCLQGLAYCIKAYGVPDWALIWDIRPIFQSRNIPDNLFNDNPLLMGYWDLTTENFDDVRNYFGTRLKNQKLREVDEWLVSKLIGNPRIPMPYYRGYKEGFSLANRQLGNTAFDNSPFNLENAWLSLLTESEKELVSKYEKFILDKIRKQNFKASP